MEEFDHAAQTMPAIINQRRQDEQNIQHVELFQGKDEETTKYLA